ncbi:enoyl-CoA hydratase-related protein [Labrys wisconsinensis]|uniref:Methylglutaconyl-CoA hydratase n=1 Tax=Labrys wisconsinensis TaxID=425677 RepID=A0ABU0J7L4_9HYPH|nr:enoyl-CoA hydratase-related protein [Labrys wisconsinensis]MDQ0470258.1 methylglutaconyl-CoA hydratase [Labrys wisconsinensis]
MSLRIDRDGPTALLTLDRPAAMNALDAGLIASLTRAYAALGQDPAVRAVVLQAEGPIFSAGADLDGMRRMAEASEADNLADARALAGLMRTLDTCPKATLARIHGSAFGGAIGLIACCDIAVAVPEAQFALSEVRLGLIPATIGPYVVRAVGPRATRRLFVTAERFSAAEALRLGLVHEVAEAGALDQAIGRQVQAVLKGGPAAIAAAKRLVADVDAPIDAGLIEETARRIAETRASPEAREGIAAFFGKRKPGWSP